MGEPTKGQSMEALMKAMRAGNGHAIRQPTVNTDFEIAQVADTVIYLRVFPWSLKDDAKDWLESLPEGEIDSWTTMEDKFLHRFFPDSKAAKLQSDVNHFVQKSTETLYDSWTRFGEILRNCPQHGLNNFNKVQIFYKGVSVPTRKEIDIAAGGSLMKKTLDEAYDIISKTAPHSYNWHQEMDMESITKEMYAMKVGCELCQGPHLTKDCNQSTMEEQVNYLGNQYNNQYQGGSSSYQMNRPPGFVNGNQNQSYVDKGPSLEELLRVFIINTDESITTLRKDSESIKQQVRSQQASIQNLEWDVGRIAQSLIERPPGALPSNTQINPNVNGPPRTILTNNHRNDVKNKEPQVSNYSQVDAISGVEGYSSVEVIPTYTHNGVDGWIRVSDITPAYGNYLMSLMKGSSSSSGNQESEVKSVETTESSEVSIDGIKVEEEKPSPKLKVYKPPIPYPRAIQSEQPKDTVCLPNYGKFLKDLMAKKGEHAQAFSTFLEVKCASILEKSDVPPKLGDPGLFKVPSRIDDSKIFRCLTDSGASINLIPLSVYSRLGLNELKSTNTGVRLVNQSISKPIVIGENLVVKIGELEFPADFVVVDMPEDKVVPVVLGRPFLATAGALTDWRTCKLILRDRGKTLSFQTKFSVKPPPTHIDFVNVLASENNNVKTETSKKPKCGGGVVKEKHVVKPPDDSVVDRSMRRLFGRVKKAINEKDEQLRLRLFSNYLKKRRKSSKCDDNRGTAFSAEPSVTPFRDYIALHPVIEYDLCEFINIRILVLHLLDLDNCM
ncbi:uncharacterized protein [Rutidosis leptorrhynchoides]|uniref:uncharacterized protein n=1 Tax=Rutidosis leptorrhynchoides TaxID=125765 RepID=UPI003A998598